MGSGARKSARAHLVLRLPETFAQPRRGLFLHLSARIALQAGEFRALDGTMAEDAGKLRLSHVSDGL